MKLPCTTHSLTPPDTGFPGGRQPFPDQTPPALAWWTISWPPIAARPAEPPPAPPIRGYRDEQTDGARHTRSPAAYYRSRGESRSGTPRWESSNLDILLKTRDCSPI